MADYNVRIKVDPSDAVQDSKKVEKALENIQKRADSTARLIKRAFAGLGIAALIRQLISLTDTYTNLQNRLRVVVSGTTQLNKVTEELYRISQRTRSSFAGSVELYARVALATREMGIEQKQLTQFTETLNKAIILSGASAQEASAGLIQFSQGIASGALRGDELRSVLEQLPAVADILAKQLGVTRGELRTMGFEGKITADVILEAFKNAREEVAERFAKTVPTVSQAFVVLRNGVIRAIGSFDQALGSSRALASFLLYLADNAETLIRVLGALAITLGTLLAGQAIQKAIGAVQALTAAMAANPIGAIIIGLTLVISFLTTFSDKLTLVEGKLATLHDIGAIVWDDMKKAFGAFVDYFEANLGFVYDLFNQVFGGFEFTMAGFIKFSANIVDRFVGFWITGYKYIIALWDNFPGAVKEILINVVNAMLIVLENGINQFLVKMNNLFEQIGIDSRLAMVEFDKVANSAEGSFANLGKGLSEAVNAGIDFSGVSDYVDVVFTKAEKLAIQRKKNAESEADAITKVVDLRSKEDKAFTDILNKLKQENQLLRLSNQERAIQEQVLAAEEKLKRSLTDAERGLIEAQLRENQALSVQSDLFNQIRGPIEEYKTTVAGLNALLEKGRITQDEYNLALKNTQLGGALEGVKTDLGTDYSQELADLQNRFSERMVIVQQARDVEIISLQEFNALELEIMRQHQAEITQLQLQRFQTQLSAGKQSFDALTSIAKTYAGEQSGIYKGLFAATKAFAIAESTVAIAQGIAKSAALGFPANIPAITETLAATAGLVAKIQGASYSGNSTGFQSGGTFRVGGAGGPDSQLVAFRASPNETVNVRTPGQERQAANNEQSSNGEGGQGLNILNVVDPGMIEDFLTSPAGEKTFVNVIRKNKTQIGQLIK